MADALISFILMLVSWRLHSSSDDTSNNMIASPPNIMQNKNVTEMLDSVNNKTRLIRDITDVIDDFFSIAVEESRDIIQENNDIQDLFKNFNLSEWKMESLQNWEFIKNNSVSYLNETVTRF